MAVLSNQSKIISKELEFLEHNVILNHKSYLILVPSPCLMVHFDCLVLQTKAVLWSPGSEIVVRYWTVVLSNHY